MGWYGEYGTRTATQVQKDILKDINPKVKVLKTASTSFGRNFWMACEIVETGETFVALYLIKPGKEASYKPLDESMGPCEVNCPLALLDMTEDKKIVSQFNVAWREKVRNYHSSRRTA